jgi:LAO/AO transport system kinase
MISIIERRELGRILSAVQNDPDNDGAAAASYYRGASNRPSVIALTGPPGAGKSTLLDSMALHWAERGEQVALLAIDPSSPFSGGAMLGDRIRANAATSNANVYMRSMSARESLDRLIAGVVDSCAVFARFGFDRVLVETVGAGQMNLEALDIADCIIGVSVPGLGDGVQLSKAGLLEIADIHVVNKSDLDGADKLRIGLESMLDIAYPAPGRPFGEARRQHPGASALLARHGDPEREESWLPPVLAVSGATGAGVATAGEAAERFLDWQEKTLRRQTRHERRMKNVVSIRVKEKILRLRHGHPDDLLALLAKEIVAGRLDPTAAAERLLAAEAGTGRLEGR